jgi:hypothetical protein
MWFLAQERRQLNRQFSMRNLKKHEYLLCGLVKCGCGTAMCGMSRGDYRYYLCTWRNNRHAAPRQCWARSVRADALESDVWESALGLFSDKPRLECLLRIAQQEELDALDPKQAELGTVEGLIADTERKAAEIGHALKAAVGVVTKTLKDDMLEVNARYEALLARREKLIADLSTRRLTDSAVQDLLDFADAARLGMENADYATMRTILEAMKLSVVVRDGRFYVTSIAGTREGVIRRMPSDWRQAGAKLAQFVPGVHSIAILPNTDQECKKVVRGRE